MNPEMVHAETFNPAGSQDQIPQKGPLSCFAEELAVRGPGADLDPSQGGRAGH